MKVSNEKKSFFTVTQTRIALYDTFICIHLIRAALKADYPANWVIAVRLFTSHRKIVFARLRFRDIKLAELELTAHRWRVGNGGGGAVRKIVKCGITNMRSESDSEEEGRGWGHIGKKRGRIKRQNADAGPRGRPLSHATFMTLLLQNNGILAIE